MTPIRAKHRRAVRRRDQDQGFHCCLPLRGLMLGFREFRDVLAGILERGELTTARQRDGFIEAAGPAVLTLHAWQTNRGSRSDSRMSSDRMRVLFLRYNLRRLASSAFLTRSRSRFNSHN
jgi:hypothetical protein